MPTDLRPTAWACRVFCTGLVALSWLVALAQETPQRVEITGSSIKRTGAETALPVQVLTRKDVAATGVVNAACAARSARAVRCATGRPWWRPRPTS
jgi:iron complex outermembrane receptor protein